MEGSLFDYQPTFYEPSLSGRLTPPRSLDHSLASRSAYSYPHTQAEPRTEVVEELVTTSYRRTTSPAPSQAQDSWVPSGRSFTPTRLSISSQGSDWDLASPAGASSYAGSSVGPVSPQSYYDPAPTRRGYTSTHAPPPGTLYDPIIEEGYRRGRPPSPVLSYSPPPRSVTPPPATYAEGNRTYIGGAPQRDRSPSPVYRAPSPTYYRPPPSAHSPSHYPAAHQVAPEEEVYEERFSTVTTYMNDGTATTQYSSSPPRLLSSTPPPVRPPSPVYVEPRRPMYYDDRSFTPSPAPSGGYEEEIYEETVTSTRYL